MKTIFVNDPGRRCALSGASYSFSTPNIVPIGKHILLLGIISYVLSFVCMFDHIKQTKDTCINYNCQSWVTVQGLRLLKVSDIDHIEDCPDCTVKSP